jgi:hypothetical protein
MEGFIQDEVIQFKNLKVVVLKIDNFVERRRGGEVHDLRGNEQQGEDQLHRQEGLYNSKNGRNKNN